MYSLVKVYKICLFDCKRLPWHSHIKYLIGKLNLRNYLGKRAKGELNLYCIKLLFNPLVKPIFKYCCSVWGNTRNDHWVWCSKLWTRNVQIVSQVIGLILKIPIATTLGYLLLMPWLYQNAGQTLVCEHFMRVRPVFGIV